MCLPALPTGWRIWFYWFSLLLRDRPGRRWRREPGGRVLLALLWAPAPAEVQVQGMMLGCPGSIAAHNGFSMLSSASVQCTSSLHRNKAGSNLCVPSRCRTVIVSAQVDDEDQPPSLGDWRQFRSQLLRENGRYGRVPVRERLHCMAFVGIGALVPCSLVALLYIPIPVTRSCEAAGQQQADSRELGAAARTK